MYYVVTYDVATDTREGQRRLRRVAQACEGYGQRVQKSVFECVLDEVRYVELVHRLGDLIRRDEDSVRIYRTQDFTKNSLIVLGKNLGLELGGTWVV
ncbi:MAG: CRISPR-associated endonuclease Cas2 [Alicyclobacillus mali]|uniref:CRISPR-associated endonuclease Cas2 n=1 Tax=Alicyclobacillus mali (ex Roth et al. 2021) TaxID=1123961 RepID=UPI0008377EFC|nr:CRISPR-associated endonuclease Cas2 [Alicyclobacillus mali (ex Roth et al. 2021)]MCL6489068.1 CRISPR-associated endonuclease Cas2 [Alicyclobacillus mali (ex Roth et al. 2021)]